MSKIIICLFLIISLPILSQDVGKLVEFEKRFLFTKGDTLKNSILVEKFDYSLKSSLFDTTTLKLGNRINFNFIKNKDTLNTFLWNMSLLSVLQKDLNMASSYISLYINHSKDTAIQVQLLNFLIYKDQPSINTNFIENLIVFDSSFRELTCYNQIKQDDSSYKKYIKRSKFLPGLGTYQLGEKRKGIISFVLIGSSTFAIYELVKHKLYINAVGFFLVYWLKFYEGNSLLTEDVIYKKLKKKENDSANECEVVFNKIMSKYPLGFK